MRALVTGVSGLDRNRVFRAIGQNVDVHDLGNLMLEIAKDRGMELTEKNILHAVADTRSALRAAAVARLLPLLPAEDDGRMAVISSHSVFSRLDGLEEGLQMQDLKDLAPAIWVTLIDGPQSIEERLKQHGAEYFHMSVWDIVKWQELEVFYSHHLAADLHIKHYVVPVTQPEVLKAIIKKDARPTPYASYAMSHATSDVKPKIATFVERLKKHFIVFDPSSIESSHGLKAHHSNKDRQAIGSHTIVRDLDWFIRINADEVIAYWPAVIFTSGMSDELRYAFEHGKRTILVTELTKEGGLPLLSPFMTYKAAVFWSSSDFFAYLELPEQQKQLFRLCQEVMVEAFRLHDAGAISLDQNTFIKECEKEAEYRLSQDAAKFAQSKIAAASKKVFASWKQILSQASRKGVARQQVVSSAKGTSGLLANQNKSKKSSRPTKEKVRPSRKRV